MEINTVIIYAIIAVLGYLLSQKDAKQAEEIALLFKKHDADVAELIQLRIQIASNHYERGELDRKFDKLDATITAGFQDLGRDIKDMTKALNNHLTEHSKDK